MWRWPAGADHEDCDDGISGTGDCTCALGFEPLCGIPSRLVPAPDPPPDCPIAGCALSQVVLDPLVLRRLRADNDTHRAPRQIHGASVARVLPTPLRATTLRLVAFDEDMAQHLGLAPDALADEAFTEYFTGRRLLPGSSPYSHVYGGHQFGSWSGQLGDGRAISLGHLHGFEISLKGAGRTPLSRAGDGRAVLQSLCREFLGGAALNALGVPSARALAVIGSDDPSDGILRDEWYTGQTERKIAGVLVRVAPSFIRFGSFQLAAKRQGVSGVVELARLALGTIAEMESRDDDSVAYLRRARLHGGAEGVASDVREQCFFTARAQPSCAAAAANSEDDVEVLRCLLERAVERSAALVAAWTAVGFAHGVMNTDNMSILGITLDMNVYGFMEAYDEGYVANHIDDESRYAFGKQAEMMRWNLRQLASALNVRSAELGRFDGVYDRCLDVRRRLRLGLPPNPDDEPGAVQAWVRWLRSSGADLNVAHHAVASGSWLEEDREGWLGTGATAGARMHSDLREAVERSFRGTCSALDGVEEGEEEACQDSQGRWQRHVAAMNPSLVMRTAALREVTLFAAENAAGGSAALQEMLELVKQPFTDAEGQPSRDGAEGLGAAEEAVARAVAGMRGGGGGEVPQTSCGGQ